MLITHLPWTHERPRWPPAWPTRASTTTCANPVQAPSGAPCRSDVSPA